MDFAALPPEVNSARMYAGPGSGPLMTAALAWNGLASDLYWAAAHYRSTITSMTSGPWRGPASASMAAAAAPYVAWMESTAAQATQAAGQAQAAVAAYEAAFAMTVPPPAIAANRALLAELVATNLLGQNTPAIATTEADYSEMWAQDAAAMYGYAGSSAAATQLTAFESPVQTANSTGLAAQSAAVAQTAGTSASASTQTALSQLTATVPPALQSLASPATSTSSSSSTGISGILDLLAGNNTSTTGFAGLFNDIFSSNGLGLNDNFWNTIFSSGFYMPGNFLGNMVDFLALNGGASEAADAAGAAAGAAGDAAGAASGVGNAMGGLGSGVSAGVGNAAPIGPLSVPPAWTTAPPPLAATPLLPNPPMYAPPVGRGPANMLGGMPLAAPPGRGPNDIPRYGFRPTIVSHPPAAG